MLESTINYWAVLVCGVANMVLGSLWYGPVFGEKWMGLVGKTKEEIEANPPSPMIYLYSFGVSLLMAYVLAHIGSAMGVDTLMEGIRLGIYAWLGISVGTSLPHYLFEGRPMKLFSVNFGYSLVGLMIFGAIIGTWQ